MYQPQTTVNRTVTGILAKLMEKGGRDWDMRLPYVLFAYRASMQTSTMESPFFLLYGRDPRLPTETALTAPVIRSELDIVTYKEEVVRGLTEAWGVAQSHVRMEQEKQKRLHDQLAAEPCFQVGDRVFLYELAAKSSKSTSLQDHMVGHIALCVFTRMGLRFVQWISLRRQRFEWHSIVFVSALPKSLTTAANQIMPWWLKP